MNFFRRYRLDIDELLNELKAGSQDKKISPPEDFAAKVMKSLDDNSTVSGIPAINHSKKLRLDVLYSRLPESVSYTHLTLPTKA